MKDTRHDTRFYLVIAALSLLAALVTSSCSAGLKTWSGNFAGCEKHDLGQLVTLGGIEQTVEQGVSTAITKGESGIAADLTSILAQLGGTVAIDTVDCAITAAENSYAPAVGSAMPATGAIRPKPTKEIAAARGWVTQHRSGR